MIPEKTTEILDRYFKSFIDRSRDWDFFLGLADYVKYAVETPVIAEILKDIVQKRIEAEESLDRYEKEAIKEIEKVKNKLFRRLKQKKISYDSLSKLMQKYEDYKKNRKILTPESDVQTLSGCLKDIIRNLYDNGYKEIIKDLIIEERMPLAPLRESKKTYIRGFTCFKNLDAYGDEEKFYNKKQDVELWGALDGLISIYHLFIFNEKKTLDQFRFQKDAYISYATRIHNYLIQELSKEEVEKQIPQLKNSLKSIHLISHSLEPQTVIFLVLDERFEIPIRCAVKNKRGEETYIKKLYNIAYIVNVPGKRVDYNRNLANDINNGLFRRRQIVKYMKTNKLKKPTLIQKSEDGDYLVLKNEIPVKTGLVNHNVPVQYQSLYIDKTK